MQAVLDGGMYAGDSRGPVGGSIVMNIRDISNVANDLKEQMNLFLEHGMDGKNDQQGNAYHGNALL